MQKRNYTKVRTLSLLVGIALSASCGDSPVAPTTSPVAPRFDFTNGPAAPGPIVYRADDPLFLWLSDPETDLVVVFGLPTDPTNLDFCGGSEGNQSIHTQYLTLPSGAIAWLQKEEDRNVLVYDRSSFLGQLPDFCAAFAGGTILARGTARLVRTDNDITGFGGPGVNSFGATARGIVQDETSGESLSLRAVGRFLLTQDGSFRVIVSKITMGS